MWDQESNLEFPKVTQPHIQVLAQTASFLFLSFYHLNQNWHVILRSLFKPADDSNDFRIPFLQEVIKSGIGIFSDSSYEQKDATTPNIVGPRMLGVVASGLALVC